ncbi:phosphatase PAP2 family protein [Candidatus Saccharibacteria bacterium]|nr:phosphatase PAP2 family protein [Candidatus Saccharibacteria bacterium]
MQWDKISDIILFASFAVLAVFAILGFCQWIKRKSLGKVDKPLLWVILPLSLTAATYVIFDKFLVLNTRPNGSGEPSFPSTHVMIVATIFFITAIILPKYIKSKTACAILDLMMVAFLVFVCVGRVLANMHWISDVIGGLVFATIFATIYYLIIRRYKNG